MTVFHEGERAVQERAGVRAHAERLGSRMVEPVLDAGIAAFLAGQELIIASSSDAEGRVWATPLFGPGGLAEARSPHALLLRADVPDDDPLSEAIADGGAVGLLAIDPLHRQRVRVNGRAERHPDGFVVQVGEVFGNCPKYIARRAPVAVLGERAAATRTERLDGPQRALITSADTLFIASRHPERGADASHRGGPPGFVTIDGDRLALPDYVGNNMFQTLGNLTVDPAVGLLSVDWETGTTLQVSGRAAVAHEPERRLEIDVEAVIERRRGMPARWELRDRPAAAAPSPRLRRRASAGAGSAASRGA